MNRHRIVGAIGHERIRLPGCPPLGEDQPGLRTDLVVTIEGQPARPKLKARHQPATFSEMAFKVGDHLRFGSWSKKDHDVSRQRNEIKPTVQIHVDQIGQMPRQLGSLPPGGAQHCFIKVNPCDRKTSPGHLDRDPSGPTSGIEERT